MRGSTASLISPSLDAITRVTSRAEQPNLFIGTAFAQLEPVIHHSYVNLCIAPLTNFSEPLRLPFWKILCSQVSSKNEADY